MYERQTFVVEGRHRFWGGLALGTVDGGEGLMAQHRAAAERTGIVLRHRAAVEDLVRDETGAIGGVVVRSGRRGADAPRGRRRARRGRLRGGPAARAAYLGPNWDVAKVRGTPHNTGEVLHAALDHGAQAYGHWSGCHAIQWDAGAPPTGDRALTNRYSRQSYPNGIVVNRHGERFLDEGADFRNYTYARFGAEVLRQPEGIAAQIFDARTATMLRAIDYEAPGATRVDAGTIAGLAEGLGIDPERLERTVRDYNAAIRPGPFDPSVKDGKGTEGLSPPKSNWALPIETPPFVAFPVRAGSPSRSAASAWTPPPACSTAPGARCRACARRASSSAACSSTTTPAAAASRPGRCSGAGPGAPRQPGAQPNTARRSCSAPVGSRLSKRSTPVRYFDSDRGCTPSSASTVSGRLEPSSLLASTSTRSSRSAVSSPAVDARLNRRSLVIRPPPSRAASVMRSKRVISTARGSSIGATPASRSVSSSSRHAAGSSRPAASGS